MKREYLESIQKVNKLDNAFLQQLVWLIYCPPIASIEGLSYHFAHQENIAKLVEWANKLKTEPPAEEIKYIPLGKYAEKLIKFYLANNNATELIEANIQLIENNKTTIGELDYLFEDKILKQYIHLEFSIKYYLKTTRDNKLIFLGPSTKDFMARKLKRLVNHQTKLSKSHWHILPAKLQAFNFKPKAVIKGCLFYPWDEWNHKTDKNETNEGWWLTIDQINHFESRCTYFSLITKKVNWIFPFNKVQELLLFDNMKVILENNLVQSNEVMVVCIDVNKNPIDRGFVMRKNWPD